ncbi:WD40 repeat domain-containing protein [Micromonospora sp. NPDC003197]
MIEEQEASRLMHVDIESIEAPPSRYLDVDRAMRTGRRQRWYGPIAGAAALVAALVMGVTLLPGLLPAANDIDETGGGGSGRMVVTAYNGIANDQTADPGPADDYSLLLNPRTGKYDRLNYNKAIPSPDGSRVLVGSGDNSLQYPSRLGIMDRTTGVVRWIEAPDWYFGYSSIGGWSPDGRQILLSHKPKSGKPGFGLVDVDSLRLTQVELPDLDTHDAAGLGLVWTPGGDEIALTLSEVFDERGHRVSGIRFYDLTGKALRTIPATAALASDAAFSPDGTRMALTEVDYGPEPLTITIVDTATGAVRQTLTAPSGTELLGWRDNRHLAARVYGASSSDASAGPSQGAALQGRLSVIDLTGRETHRMSLPDELAQQIYIGPATGLPAGSATYTF